MSKCMTGQTTSTIHYQNHFKTYIYKREMMKLKIVSKKELFEAMLKNKFDNLRNRIVLRSRKLNCKFITSIRSCVCSMCRV